MEFFDQLGKRLGEVARQVEEKSGELFEVGKLNIEIFKEEEAIRRINRKIGELIYHAFSKDQDYGGMADGYCTEISERMKRVDALKAKIEEVRRADSHGESQREEEAPVGEDAAMEGFKVVHSVDRESEPPVCEVQ